TGKLINIADTSEPPSVDSMYNDILKEQDTNIESIKKNGQKILQNAQTIISNPDNYSEEEVKQAKNLIDGYKGVLTLTGNPLVNIKLSLEDLQKTVDPNMTTFYQTLGLHGGKALSVAVVDGVNLYV